MDRRHARCTSLFIAAMTATLLITAASPLPAPELASRGESGWTGGCSAVSLDNNGYAVFAYNKDHEYVRGVVVVNKRYVAKSGWEPSTRGEYATWVSKYGSVTFNHAGYQLPSAGMNEAGLTISTHALDETENPGADERPPLGSALWAQYVLDNFGTVEEVLASDADVRIKDTVDHYLVCDRTGDCATVEFLHGEMVYHTGASLPVKALTNNTYEDSVQAWQQASPEALYDVNSLYRFHMLADNVLAFEPTSADAAVEYAFETLAQVSMEATGPSIHTAWSIVFDTERMLVFFRTYKNEEIRIIDFSRLDFSCSSPVQMLDVHAPLSGDISDRMPEYSHRANLDHTFESLQVFGVDIPSPLVRALVWGVERSPCMQDAGVLPYGGGAGVPLPPVLVWPGLHLLEWWYSIWIPLVMVSLAILIWDLARGTQLSWGKRAAWGLGIVFLGPVGLPIYWLACRRRHTVPALSGDQG
jgi:penicillin V acylase-like amidase (Ntn superfamily)